jgi:hypothetical protein
MMTSLAAVNRVMLRYCARRSGPTAWAVLAILAAITPKVPWSSRARRPRSSIRPEP